MIGRVSSKGVKRVYRQGRKAFDQVKAEATVENLHEWRKQVKYLRHQLELLAPTWPKVVGELAKPGRRSWESCWERIMIWPCSARRLHRPQQPTASINP